MFEVHQPSVWNFGHSHVNREFLIGETKFRRLAETAYPNLLSTRRKSMRSRAQKPSLLLRPALLVWFEVRVTRVCVQKSASINKVNPLEPRLV
jgi:hypothetical protein